MSERLNLTVEDGVGELMSELAGGERKRGQWLSDLARAIHETESLAQSSDVEQLRMSFAGLAGSHKQLEGKVMSLERQVGALIASGARG